MSTYKRYIPSYGRKVGRRLTNNQKGYLNNSEYIIGDIAPILEAHCESRDLILEVGFGNGNHVLGLATSDLEDRQRPSTIIACDPYANGTAQLLRQLKLHTPHLRHKVLVYNGDFRHLLDEAPKSLISTIYVLFPDPWPKTKQQKKRLLQADTLQLCHHLLKHSGQLIFASDHQKYAEQVLGSIQNGQWQLKRYITLKSASDYQSLGILTSYAQKAIITGSSSYYICLTAMKC